MTSATDGMYGKAGQAAHFLKEMSDPHRLILLCQLTEGDYSAAHLSECTGMSEGEVSQHLLDLEKEEMVASKQSADGAVYTINEKAVTGIVEILCDLFDNKCEE